MSLDSYFPPAEVVLNLKPEELAIPLLNCLIGREEPGTDLNLGNFVRGEEFDRFGGEKAEDIRKLVTESWAWLERELMIAPNFKLSPGWVYVTKKAASHNWWKFDLAISYPYVPSQSILLSNQCFL